MEISANLKKRIFTAVILKIIVLLIGYFLLVTGLVTKGLLVVCALLTLVSCFEFVNIVSANFIRKITYALLLLSPLFFTIYLFWENLPFEKTLKINLSILLLTLVCTSLLAILIGKDEKDQSKQISIDLFIGIVGIFLGLLSLINIATFDRALFYLLWLILVVSFNDSGAYFIGKAFSGGAIAKYISPNKTLHGSLGGFLMGIIIGVATSPLVFHSFNLKNSFLLSILIILASQIGDLLISLLKRIHDKKDTGKIFPGHGGLLDRIDGILLPAVVLYIFLINI